MSIREPKSMRELDRRSADGLDVRLLWNAETNEVVLAVVDERSEEAFELDVDPAEALSAFRHPYAYAGRGRHPSTLTA